MKLDSGNACYHLVTSSLIRGIQIGEISKLGWPIGLLSVAIWADLLYSLYLLLLAITKIVASFQMTPLSST
jgi:hypothetical protein